MKRCIRAMLLVFVLFGGSLIANKLRFHYDWGNAFWRTLLAPFTGTVWPENFSEIGFSKIKVGIPKSEVTALAGEPLRKSCDEDGCLWSYAGQEMDELSYDRRWVSFDANDRVTKIRHEFYID